MGGLSRLLVAEPSFARPRRNTKSLFCGLQAPIGVLEFAGGIVPTCGMRDAAASAPAGVAWSLPDFKGLDGETAASLLDLCDAPSAIVPKVLVEVCLGIYEIVLFL